MTNDLTGALAEIEAAVVELQDFAHAVKNRPNELKRMVNVSNQALAKCKALREAVPDGDGVLGKALKAKHLQFTHSVDMGGKHVMPKTGEQRIYAAAALLQQFIQEEK